MVSSITQDPYSIIRSLSLASSMNLNIGAPPGPTELRAQRRLFSSSTRWRKFSTTLIFDTELSRFFIRDAPLSRPATLVICRPVPGICLSSQGVPRRARRKPIERGTTLEPGPRGVQERLS